MLENIINFAKKHWGFVLYFLFGILTTLVNYLVYLPLYNYCNFSAAVSNGIAWAASVIVAFVTNKPFVFKSSDWSLKVAGPEFTRFVSCRLCSGVIETVFLWLTVDFLQSNGNVWKIVTSVLVIIINYIGSKFLVFQKK